MKADSSFEGHEDHEDEDSDGKLTGVFRQSEAGEPGAAGRADGTMSRGTNVPQENFFTDARSP